MARNFASLYSHDFVRIGSCVPRTKVAGVEENLAETIQLAKLGSAAKAAIVLFPELGLSSYAIDDLFFQHALQDAVQSALARLVEASCELFPALIVGAPLQWQGSLYNAAVVIHNGAVLGVIPKTYLPNYREYYERRYFQSGAGICGERIKVGAKDAPFGTDLLFCSEGSLSFTFHVEICEDLWAPIPPSTGAALAGAELLFNLSASNIVIGKAETRRLLCASQSERALAAYAYSAAGPGESTQTWPGMVKPLSSNAEIGSPRRNVSRAIRKPSSPMLTLEGFVKSGCA